MEIKVNELTNSQQEVEVNLEYNEIIPEIEDAYSEERKSIVIDGFRKGKAPMSMIKKLYGEAIEYKASEKIANKKFWDIVDEKNLKPISTPQMTDIDFVPGTKLSFKVKYEIKPKLELKNYKNLEIEKPIFKIKDEDIEKEIDYLIRPHFQFEESELVTDKFFRITVNLQRIDAQGVPMIGSRNENMLIDLSDEKVNIQIVDNAQNKKVGDSFNFTFVDEHHHGEELHREEFTYTAEITKIEKIVKPEFTEELIKKLSANKASTLDELKAMLHKNFEEYYKKQTEEIVTNNLLSTVVKNNEFTPPPGYVSSIHRRLVDLERENSKRYKTPHFDEHAVAEYYKPRAEWNAKWQIILENLAEAENIKVEDSQLEELAKEESDKTGISVAKLVKYYKDTNRTEMLLEEKVVKFLIENAKIKEVDAEEKSKEKKEKHNEA
ncbi:MAG: trigger factor [Bacteroidetes bacterium]|nr:trigger factor [Bacteroidota bacterium]MCL6100736.1 trigger factor [Bacteroidota bacterium]